MSLITPDFGLLFWMVIIFGMVFFILAKFGFPIISGMVDKRNEHIEESLRAADQARAQLSNMAQEQARMIEQTRAEQGRILKEASDTRAAMIEAAKSDASAEAAKILEEARVQIAAEKESALRDIRREVAMLSVEVAEKVVRRSLQSEDGQMAFIDALVDEASRAELN